MRLLLIEDDQAYQLAMASRLRQLAGVEDVWVADDGEQGLRILRGHSVDLVLLDLLLPGLDGLAVCRDIVATSSLPVLILTSRDDPGSLQQIWGAGARGFLHKEQAWASVDLAVRSLLAGASWWDQKATEVLQRSISSASPEPQETVSSESLARLTAREREVLACLAGGANNRAIAACLGIGEGTVRSHVHGLLQKLEVSNRTQAALIWLAAAGRKAR